MTKWFVLIGVILFLCTIEWIREVFTFKITHYSITSNKLSGLKQEKKIIFLTDLHNNSYGRNNRKLYDAIMKQSPDLILIGGDMVVGLPGAQQKVALEFVSSLTKICPVYYANGNHEQRMEIYPETYGSIYQEYKNELMQAGVIFLENQREDILLDDCFIQLYGLEIPAMGYKKFKKTTLNADEVEACVGKPDQDKYQILLAHNPIYADAYLKWGADLVLSGHLHGGIVRIPGVGGIITPQFRFFPKYSGEHTKVGTSDIVVSKGLGTHTIKVRFLNPAEVVVLHMQKR